MGRILNNTPTPAPTALHNSTSQGSPDSATPTGSGNFNPLLGVVVSVVIISFFVVGFSSSYIRRRIWGYEYEMRQTELMRRRSRRMHARRGSSKAQHGLNPEIVAAIPLVPYKDLPADEREEKYFDCAVCLAVFDATDSLKLLPQCSHAFHSDCIDEWFRSRSTCPLCRVSLDPSTGKSSSRGGPRSGLEGDNADDDGGNPDGIRVPVDFDVADMDGDGAISGFESQGGTPTVSIAPTVDTSAGGEGQVVDPRSIVCMKTGEFSSFVPTIRVGISPPKAALASIRRSSSESTDLQLLRHSGYVVDNEGTQHHRNFQVHATAVDAQDQGHGLPTLRPVSLSGSSPNLRQISPEWKSLEGVEGDSNS